MILSGAFFATMQITWIVIIVIAIVLILVIVGSVIRAVSKMKRNIQRKINNSVTAQIYKTVAGPVRRGEVDLGNIMKQAVTESQEEEVKSVSAMTSLMLPRIVKDFPGFEYDEMREKVKLAVISYLGAISQGNADMLTDVASEVRRNVENTISTMNNNRVSKHYDSVKIHQCEITQYNKNAGRCVINFQMSVEYFEYTTDTAGNVTEGSKTSKHQTRYNADLVYVQDREIVEQSEGNSLGLNCPNCGAPVKMLGAKSCPYCGTGIVELNLNAWMINRIYEYRR